MTISITQTCDGCRKTRSLNNVGYHGGRSTIRAQAKTGGWRDVQEFKHLCPECITKAISPTTEETP